MDERHTNGQIAWRSAVQAAAKTAALTCLCGIVSGQVALAEAQRVEEAIPAHAASLSVSLAEPLMVAGAKQVNYIKVGLTGETPANERQVGSNEDQQAAGRRTQQRRAAVNVALVVDRSGSMQGAKLAQAKRAAIAALRRLQPTDIVSVIVYDQGVRVVLPATKLSDRATVESAIQTIGAGGSTALFAGVSKGAAEVRKFLTPRRVNRVILLSDGRANIGPASPSALAELGASLQKEGIAVTTLGLGLDYHEDLMSQLAAHSHGTHRFVEAADQLMDVFQQEFDDVLSVVAQDIQIRITTPPGVRPVRVMGQAADIHGQQVTLTMNQLYAAQERFVLLEVEIPATPPDQQREVADVKVCYARLDSDAELTLDEKVHVDFCDDGKQSAARRNRDVLESWVLLVASQRNRFAMQLRDEGRLPEAYQLLMDNREFLLHNSTQLDSHLLQQQGAENGAQANWIDGANWKKTRKMMMRNQYAVEQQASGYGGYGGGGYGGYGSGYGAVQNEADYGMSGKGYGGRGKNGDPSLTGGLGGGGYGGGYGGGGGGYGGGYGGGPDSGRQPGTRFRLGGYGGYGGGDGRGSDGYGDDAKEADAKKNRAKNENDQRTYRNRVGRSGYGELKPKP